MQPIISQQHQTLRRMIAFGAARYVLAFAFGFAIVILLVEAVLSHQNSLSDQFCQECGNVDPTMAAVDFAREMISRLAEATGLM